MKMTDICGNVRKFASKFEITDSMRRFFRVFCGLMVTVSMLTSCLKSDDSTVTTYSDMVITEFSLGTLNRYLTTKTSDGRDSIYKTTYSASGYTMTIDQVGYRIYNDEPLLTGTDMSRLVCTVKTLHNSPVYVKSLTSDTLKLLISGSDSIDFTQPRTFRVFATDNSGCRDYTVAMRVRSQAPGTFSWATSEASSFPSIEQPMPNWAEELIDSADADKMPKSVMGYVTWAVDSKTDYALMVGQCDGVEGHLVIWRKVTDRGRTGRWVYMPVSEDNDYLLPEMERVVLVYFRHSVLALSSNGKIYQSRDQGVTWMTKSTYVYPTDFDASAPFEAVVVDDTLWLKQTASGKTWQGTQTD